MPVVTTTYTDWPDNDLVQASAKGRAAAFDELYRRYGQKMFSYFYRMLWKDKELAEDCTQELFLKLVQHGQRFDSGRPFSTWLYSIANNMCKNEYRRKTVRQLQPQPVLSESAMPDMQVIDRKLFRTEVVKCIDELEEDKKELFILRFEEQLSVPEISRIMDIPEGTVKSRLFYLLKHLSGKLKTFNAIYQYP
jgi:RNA polymerase sigma-70 factor, ECF subfamily